MLQTAHQAFTALLATTGSGHKPLHLYQWSERLQAYNFTMVFTPGRDNVVADLLYRATPTSAPATTQDCSEPELILMLHEPFWATISVQKLQAASAQDPVFIQLFYPRELACQGARGVDAFPPYQRWPFLLEWWLRGEGAVCSDSHRLNGMHHGHGSRRSPEHCEG